MKNSTDIKFTRDRGRYRAARFYNTQGWHQEYLDSGAQYRMTFSEFKKSKRQQMQRTRKGK